MSEDLQEFLSPAEVAEAVRKSSTSIYRGVKSGEIPHVRFLGSILIPRAWLEDALVPRLALEFQENSAEGRALDK